MDLISREAVDNAMYDYCHSCDVNESQMENYFCDLPSAFEGMTNGEVIQALFPNMKTEDTSVESLIGTDIDRGYVVFNRDWWNTPYQKGGEE